MIGKTISHFTILEKLGEGGMGIVYKAKDTKLDRFVALKFLPHFLTANETEKARFLQEAKAASAINHANVCVIYDLQEHESQQFIVMEYVDGSTLRDIISNSAPRKLDLRSVMNFAFQIAEALQVAHEQGIMHRDVKSENIMVNTKNQIKVMDFGLAKLKDSLKLTKTTSTLGTVAYMSPEMIQGQGVDARSDIFSFGVVLYEMLTGQLPFSGDFEAAMIFSILNEEPDPIHKFRPDLSSEFLHLLNRALEKEPENRYQSMKDLLIDLKRVNRDQSKSDNQPGLVTKSKSIASLGNLQKRKFVLFLSIGFSAIIAILMIVIFMIQPASSPPPITTLLTSYIGSETYPAISYDGKKFAFTWAGEKQDNEDIYIKLIGEEGLQHLTTEPEWEYCATWSNDGNSIIFIRGGEAPGIYRKSLLGGRETQLYSFNSPIFYADMIPKFSPDGQSIAFARYYSYGIRELFVVHLKNHYLQQLTFDKKEINDLAWTPDGHNIIFSSDRGGIAQLWRIRSKGGQPELLDIGGYNARSLSISRNDQRLVYEMGDEKQNIWRANIRDIDSGVIKPYRFISSSKSDCFPVYSPDGEKIAFMSNRTGIREIYTCNSDGTELIQITSLSAHSGVPKWSPSGEFLIFESRLEGNSDIMIVDALGRIPPRKLTNHPSDDRMPSWSADGQYVYFSSNRSGNYQIHKIPIRGGEAVQITTQSGFCGYESSNGKKFYYKKYMDITGPIYEINFENGEDTIAINDVCFSTVNWILNAEGIYYVSRNEKNDQVLKLFRFMTNEIEQLGELEEPFALSDVSDDFKYILFFLNEGYSSDIYLVDFYQ
ncbi:serine/threonine-protein kinase [candidate division KSB1 bacterium]|nr:protein kinase [candidate division KSB1 bacterium]RQW06529.1 MAG: serine/threonine-protein kinase [candidate division KSB1 bacterium]